MANNISKTVQYIDLVEEKDVDERQQYLNVSSMTYHYAIVPCFEVYHT